MLLSIDPKESAPPAIRCAIVIPARFGSTRFPGKPLIPLRGAEGRARPLIQRSWESACAVSGIDAVWIATDDDRIAALAQGFGAQVVHTPSSCANGTERCWAAVQAAGIRADIVVNLQGDAPLTPPAAIELLIETMAGDPSIAVATPMLRCSDAQRDRLLAEDRAGRAGGTTVVQDARGNALYFSKRVLPYFSEGAQPVPVHLHLGVYAYRHAALAAYAAAAPCSLEQAEGLEQLRFLHHGLPIRLVEIPDAPGGLWEVNQPSDVPIVEAALAERGMA